LVQDINGHLGSSHWDTQLQQCGIAPRDIANFRTELFLSQQPSVDAFLEQRGEFIQIGKISIAQALLALENEEMLFKFEIRDKGFYHYLFNQLNAGWDEFPANRLSIITFNYDRSLEHLLFTSLKHTYNKPDEITAEAVEKIPIIHVHGSLGPLPWQAVGGRSYVSQNLLGDAHTNLFTSQLQAASEKIFVLSEGQQATSEYNKAFDYLSAAERIYFLGFGYHPQNMERLRLDELYYADDLLTNPAIFMSGKFRSIRFRGSAYGLGKAQMESLQNRWHIGLPDNTSDSLKFLKEYTILD
jgi:hypothetical protein